MYTYILLEAAFILCLFLVTLRWRYRLKSSYNRRPAYQSVSFDKAPDEADYVIVGGGPAGLAAARALLEGASVSPSPSIVIIEQGEEMLPTSYWEKLPYEINYGRLLFCSPNSVYSPIDKTPVLFDACHDQHFVVRRPFRSLPVLESDACVSGIQSNEASRIRSNEIFFNYTPYPQYKGVGGGSLGDWGIHFGSAFSSAPISQACPNATEEGSRANNRVAEKNYKEKASPSWWELLARLPDYQGPLSCAFITAVTNFLKADRSTASNKSQSISQAMLRIDADGRRMPIASWIFRSMDQKSLSNLKVLQQSKVVGFKVASMVTLQEAHVTAVCFENALLKDASRKRCIVVKRGVVLAAGTLHSPRLLRQLYLSSGLSASCATLLNANCTRTMVDLRDALALPMIFKTYNGVSSDACNVWNLRTKLQWFLTHRGPCLQPLVDVMASIPLPGIGPKAELRIFLFPFGGRDPVLYNKMGWDRMLGSFEEAMTLVMVLSGVEGGLHHSLALASNGTSEDDKFIRHLGLRPLETVDPTDQNARETGSKTQEDEAKALFVSDIIGFEDEIINSFMNGMIMCRKIIRTKPLSLLTSGAEAVDFSLLREDPSKSIQLAKLMHTPAKRFTKKMRYDFMALGEWAGQLVSKENYMRGYVQEHAFWLGFGSGTSEPFLEDSVVDESGKAKPNFRVKGFRNVVVGDCSSVSSKVFASDTCNSNPLLAGSVSTSIDAGRLAAQSLTAS